VSVWADPSKHVPGDVFSAKNAASGAHVLAAQVRKLLEDVPLGAVAVRVIPLSDPAIRDRDAVRGTLGNRTIQLIGAAADQKILQSIFCWVGIMHFNTQLPIPGASGAAI
jgi:hypothetical protein